MAVETFAAREEEMAMVLPDSGHASATAYPMPEVPLMTRICLPPMYLRSGMLAIRW